MSAKTQRRRHSRAGHDSSAATATVAPVSDRRGNHVEPDELSGPAATKRHQTRGPYRLVLACHLTPHSRQEPPGERRA